MFCKNCIYCSGVYMVADTVNTPTALWRSLTFRWRTREATAVRSALNWTRSAPPAPSPCWVSLSLPHTVWNTVLLYIWLVLKDIDVVDTPQISLLLLTLWSCLKRRSVVSRCPGCQALKTTVLYLVIEIKSLTAFRIAHRSPSSVLCSLFKAWPLFYYKCLIVSVIC